MGALCERELVHCVQKLQYLQLVEGTWSVAPKLICANLGFPPKPLSCQQFNKETKPVTQSYIFYPLS